MPKLKKHSGREEEYDRAKLERSLKRAGANETHAREVADKIKHREGMTASELGAEAARELRARNAEAASRYERTGALTQNEMTVRFLWFNGKKYEVTGVGYEPDGEIKDEGGNPLDTKQIDELKLIMDAATMSSNARIHKPDRLVSYYRCCCSLSDTI